MTSVFGHEIRSEVVILYLVETLVVFLAAYSLLELATASGSGRDHLHLGVAAVSIAVSWSLAASASGLYEPSVLRNGGQLAFCGGLATLLLGLMAWLSVYLVAPPGFSAPSLVVAVAVTLSSVVAVGLTRLAHAAAKRRGLLAHHVLVIGERPALSELDHHQTDSGFIWLKPSDIAVVLEPGWLRARSIWTVVYPDLYPLDPLLLRHCRDLGVRTMTQNQFREGTLHRVAYEGLSEDWLVSSSAALPTPIAAFTRRSIDIAVSLSLITLALPVMVITAILVKLDSDGPIFYREQRCGLHKKTFMLLKFRSMFVGAKASGTPGSTAGSENQITRFGHMIRVTRIDELPQLFNVLLSDMAVVGPRPESPRVVKNLGLSISHYNDRVIVKPGITGWAQINYRERGSNEDTRMKLAYDLYYVKRRSLFLDFVILLGTIRIIFLQEQGPQVRLQ